MFGTDGDGKQKPWNFTHTGDLHHGPLARAESKVIKRMYKQRPRLPSAMYDVSG